MRAFRADFAFAPSGVDIPADTYRIGIADGSKAGTFAGNLVIPFDPTTGPAGGNFFLGLIATNASAFTQVDLFSVQTDPQCCGSGLPGGQPPLHQMKATKALTRCALRPEPGGGLFAVAASLIGLGITGRQIVYQAGKIIISD